MQKGVIRKRRPSPLSEYGRQLREKQHLKTEYNLQERQLKRYVKEALARQRGGNAGEKLLARIERRLDNIVFRMGMAQTRPQARQLVAHGHFLVNGRPVTIPSYEVRKDDRISLHPSSLGKPFFKNIQLRLKKYEPPSWLALDKENMEAKILREPTMGDFSLGIEIPLIFEFYSR